MAQIQRNTEQDYMYRHNKKSNSGAAIMSIHRDKEPN